MGYERMKDPATGRIHEMPLESYDPVKGGYHSPDFPRDPNRLLVKPRPGGVKKSPLDSPFRKGEG